VDDGDERNDDNSTHEFSHWKYHMLGKFGRCIGLDRQNADSLP
jgi:hypothetical protein